MDGLKFEELRIANVTRLPQFKDKNGRICHLPDGSDWSDAQWLNAITGELGELCNLVKKIDRGDYTKIELIDELCDELADIQTYLDITAFRLGVDLGAATRKKFNKVSERIDCDVRL